NTEALEKIAEIFETKMRERGILPKNPWKAKRTDAWLARMGARMKPGSMHESPWGRPDCANYVNFKVECPHSDMRIRGRRGWRYMRVEIPWELADKILALGYLP
ncbi:MAG: hypothetical protein EBT03_12795, partial [Betaproteobacteria bacterium]|nr:hypothetical protein [Betaproteobacteria bacterium]